MNPVRLFVTPIRVRLGLNLTSRIGLLAVLLLVPQTAVAQRFATGPAYTAPAGKSPTAELLKDIGIEQHLNQQLPLEAVFRDETGKAVKLGDYFQKGQPVVLALVYYRCPMLCTQVLNGFLHSSQAIPLEIGRDYQVVTVSFDPRETPELAAEKKKHYTATYRRPGAAEGWHFLTGDQDSIEKLATATGFRYHFDEKSDQYAHGSGIMIATPDGKISRYLYGIEYPPPDLRFGLVESSEGKIGSPVDQILLLCYHYDPLTGRYGVAISRVLKAAGVLTILTVGTFLGCMYRLERRRTQALRASLATASD